MNFREEDCEEGKLKVAHPMAGLDDKSSGFIITGLVGGLVSLLI
jgi:hypothetical protein